MFGKGLNLYPHIVDFNHPRKEALRKHFGKGEDSGNQHFPLFSQCFPANQRKTCTIMNHIEIVVCKGFQFRQG